MLPAKLNILKNISLLTHKFTSKIFFSITVSILFFTSNACLSSNLYALDQAIYQGSQFQEVWKVIASDPYEKLPHHQVTVGSFFSGTKNLLLENSRRTLSRQDDILPPFKKLVHPNGICLRGIWSIDRQNRYSGYFKQGSQALIIVRASIALSYADSGQYRAFGFAAKIFPTIDLLDPRPLKTANFFAIDDLAGTRAAHYTDVEMTNMPRISLFRLHSVALAPVGIAAGTAFRLADIMPRIRQLYEISEMEEDSSVVTPKWIKISAAKGTIPINEKDFRIEILEQIKTYGKLTFNIAVASSQNILGKKDWQDIGHIDLWEAVASESCDHRLHFHHPVFKRP